MPYYRRVRQRESEEEDQRWKTVTNEKAIAPAAVQQREAGKSTRDEKRGKKSGMGEGE
jgi:hypothetical protein